MVMQLQVLLWGQGWTDPPLAYARDIWWGGPPLHVHPGQIKEFGPVCLWFFPAQAITSCSSWSARGGWVG